MNVMKVWFLKRMQITEYENIYTLHDELLACISYLSKKLSSMILG